ncbi:hypothetical protein E2C01_078691 [Portunus trituberculatus]|uniref:Uncharacterized protein n=1 Tax=Portunus trituberculatus TaxID=210409 RepID=A0A5B7ITG3_PORTR|nr:hypothetical protein [Portunus trituberculatus]
MPHSASLQTSPARRQAASRCDTRSATFRSEHEKQPRDGEVTRREEEAEKEGRKNTKEYKGRNRQQQPYWA